MTFSDALRAIANLVVDRPVSTLGSAVGRQEDRTQFLFEVEEIRGITTCYITYPAGAVTGADNKTEQRGQEWHKSHFRPI